MIDDSLQHFLIPTLTLVNLPHSGRTLLRQRGLTAVEDDRPRPLEGMAEARVALQPRCELSINEVDQVDELTSVHSLQDPTGDESGRRPAPTRRI